MDQNRQEEIRKRAHQIWEEEGRPEGKDSEHWDRAARELDADGGERQSGKGASGNEPLAGLAEGSKSERAAEDLKSGKDARRR